MKKIILAAILLLFMPLSVQAAGIGITPKSLNVNQNSSDKTEAEVFIYNTGKDPAIYQIYSDRWSQLIKPDTPKFRLEQGESRRVLISFDRLPPGEHNVNLSVIAQDIGLNLSSPKTGFKVPVSLKIRADSGFDSYNIYGLVIGLIILALIFLILSLIRHYRRSTLERMMDAAQESMARHSARAMIKHDIRHHTLLVVSMVAMILAGVLLVWSFVATSGSLTDSASIIEQSSQNVAVTVSSPVGNKVYAIESSKPLTAFSALEIAALEYDFAIKYDPPNEMGVFVTEIAGLKNGTNKKYWVYEVNGLKPVVAADKHLLVNNDSLVWKFVIPE